MYRFDTTGQMTMLDLDTAERGGARPSADRASRTPNWFRSRISTWICCPLPWISSDSVIGSSDLHGGKASGPSIPGPRPAARSASHCPAYWRRTQP